MTGSMRVSQAAVDSHVFVLASIGTYSLNRSLVDVGLMYAVGAVGLGLRTLDVPLVPAVLGLVLGPMAEQQFRRAVAISEGDVSVFVTRPISAAFLLASVALLVVIPLGALIYGSLRNAAPGVEGEWTIANWLALGSSNIMGTMATTILFLVAIVLTVGLTRADRALVGQND